MGFLRVRKAIGLMGILGLLGSISIVIQPTAGAAGAPNESGGQAVVHHSGGAVVHPPGGKIPYAHLYRIGVNASEPTLGVTKKGDIFI
ncbi:MAG: hypothetical protein M3290_13590, partial [Actinomycetota bacterium]|nr:hypothetical protein [Actinomycetota bacterium]